MPLNGFKARNNPSRKIPYLSKLGENLEFWSLCEALVAWTDFASRSDESRWSDHRQIYRKCGASLSSSFFSLLFFPLFPSSFPLPTGLGLTCSSENLILPLVTLSLAFFDFTLSSYPHLWISLFLSGDTWPPLEFCLTISPFNTWLYVSHPTKCPASHAHSVPRKTWNFDYLII